jgi:hypothetical protein
VFSASFGCRLVRKVADYRKKVQESVGHQGDAQFVRAKSSHCVTLIEKPNVLRETGGLMIGIRHRQLEEITYRLLNSEK